MIRAASLVVDPARANARGQRGTQKAIIDASTLGNRRAFVLSISCGDPGVELIARLDEHAQRILD